MSSSEAQQLSPPLPRRGVSLAPPAPNGGEPLLDAEFTEVAPRQLRDYLRIVSKHRWLAAACAGGTLLLAVLYTLQTTRLYTAVVRLQVARSAPIKLQLKDNVLNLEEGERIVNGASSFLATQVQVLRSRDLAERVLREWLLASPPDTSTLDPASAAVDAVAASLPATLRPRGLQPAGATAAPAEAPAPPPISADLLDTYAAYLDVQDERGTDLIDIELTTPDPKLSAVLAAAHAQAYLDANAETQMTRDSGAVSFLEDQLEQSKAQLNRAEEALRQFAAENPNVAVDQEHNLVGKQMQQLSSLALEAEAQRTAAETRYEFLSKSRKEPLAHFLDASPAIQKLRLALLDVEEQRAVLKLRLGPNHPQMADLRRQAAELSVQLENEIDQEIAAAKARLTAARLQEAELHRKLEDLQAHALQLRNLGAQYELLRADLENVRGLHDSLLRQKTETAVHSQLTASNVRVVERPEPPPRPSKPNVPVNLVVGLVAAVLVAGAAVFVHEALDSSVKSRDDVEGLLQLPALAIIPNFHLLRPGSTRQRLGRLLAARIGNHNGAGVLADAKGNELVVRREPWSAVAETFRSLRTAVLFANGGAPPKLLVVTSAVAAEGKTVTSLNLAASLADAGWRVVLMDGDLRDPRCHHAFGLSNRRGLSNVLAGQCDVDAVIQQPDGPGLAVVTAGPPPPNPAEVIGSARMHELLERLRGRYDFLIVDTPPVLAATDAVVLARQADGVVLVVKGQGSPRAVVRRARDQLAQAHANLLGVVVNDVDSSWDDAGFYAHYDGYPASVAPTVAERSA
jgi:succinoglycan biosynthesis transport protein ExoP